MATTQATVTTLAAPPATTASAMSRPSRNPLTNLPNAVNSPFQSAASKRARPNIRDASGQPPAKKQHTEVHPGARTPVKNNDTIHVRMPPARKAAVRKPVHAAFGVVSKPGTCRNVPTEREREEGGSSVEQIKAWRKHYRKIFPNYIFFFENAPHDVVSRAAKSLHQLGARQEKFFSSQVTHVISNREVPSKDKSCSGNPTTSQKRSAAGKTSNTDILVRAQQYDMKIWSVEKLQRVLNGLLEMPIEQSTLTAKSSIQETIHKFNFTAQNNNIQNILRHERVHGPSDRDPQALAKDLQYFKGPMIYVHDEFATYRPIMVREYEKVPKREQGAWPQFRSVSGGKCPFIEEQVHHKRERVKAAKADTVVKAPQIERARERSRQLTAEKEAQLNKELNAASKASKTSNRPLDVLNLTHARTNALPTPDVREHTFRVPSTIPAKRTATIRPHNESVFASTNEATKVNFTGRCNQEPAASGVQPSNITSAIRSQMVSSQLNQPGQRGGTSKEIYGLQRKVTGNVYLGNQTNMKPAGRLTTSQRMVDLTGALCGKAAMKRDADGMEKVQPLKAPVAASSQRPAVKRDAKPGYCENCREKFDDFEEHALSKRHKRFATNPDNWAELDDLLSVLGRPLLPRRPTTLRQQTPAKFYGDVVVEEDESESDSSRDS